MKKTRLSKSMTISQFDSGYWYASEIKTFAKEIGVPSVSKLRKDELEDLIKHFLKTGKVKKPTRNPKDDGISDVEKGLTLKLRVVNYKNVRGTKDFIVTEALKKRPGLKEKSGVRYRLNRWREQQISKGKKITYGDVVNQYIKLNDATSSFKKVDVGRYINFLAEYMANEKGATRQGAIQAWKTLKKMDCPKYYANWKSETKKSRK